MEQKTKVVDIAAYRKAVEAKDAVDGFSPLPWAGWVMSATAGIFGVYVLLRSSEAGVFDAVVAGLLAVAAVLFLGGVALVRGAPAIRRMILTQSWNRHATEARQDLLINAPISIESVRQARSMGPDDATITCSGCGQAYNSGRDACPACGRGSRTG